jgi:preprotein translocase subunit SecG
MQTILTVVHLFLAIGLVGLILIQHGRGADAGAAFGSGASATVFGARGSGSFLSRTTAVLAALFFVTSIVLAYYAQKVEAPKGLMDGAAEAVRLEIPAVPSESGGAGPSSEMPVQIPVTPPVPKAVVSADVPVVPTESGPSPADLGGDVPAGPATGGTGSP